MGASLVLAKLMIRSRRVRPPPRGRHKDAQGGATDNVLFIILRDEDPRSRRRHGALLHLRGHGNFSVQLFHKSQQISDLGTGQGAKFKVSHSL